MTGYRIIFDREKMVMGWTESDCYHDEETSTLPINPSKSPAASPTVYPEATVNTTSKIPSASSPSDSPKLNSFTCALLMVLSAIFATV
ncbi:putative aspartic peptidase A1 family [Rosa chinensis]|uniref:Putative aspartic peptidase A1 family n=2 Tax=Rosa chinensis TaxID=74649 RepID=A0A2P6RLN7_ROSCH|nr:putative aspartic peptidase A1 family [Rosa chinensis]